MLTAITKNGKKFCLGYPYNKETLLSLRRKEEFFCPLCGERVYLKLGDQKIYHFAHQTRGACRDFYENESERHMEGKLKLFHWLLRQKIPAELEYYDRAIKQRPDIVFYYQERKYALEYQCSGLSESLFNERTKNYLKHGYIPLWILGGNHVEGNFAGTARLTNFHFLFLRKSKNGQLFIPSFSSENDILQITHSIFPYSNKNTLLKKLNQPINQVKLPFLLNPPIQPQLNGGLWKTKCESYIMHWAQYPSKQQWNFLNEIYTHHLNPFLFPPEIGVPVPSALLIRTPPFIWQTYYYLDILHGRRSGELISISQIKKCFADRMRANEILTRITPQATSINPLSAFLDYTYFLVKSMVLSQVDHELFQVKKEIVIPATNREKEERMASFYQANQLNN